MAGAGWGTLLRGLTGCPAGPRTLGRLHPEGPGGDSAAPAKHVREPPTPQPGPDGPFPQVGSPATSRVPPRTDRQIPQLTRTSGKPFPPALSGRVPAQQRFKLPEKPGRKKPAPVPQVPPHSCQVSYQRKTNAPGSHSHVQSNEQPELTRQTQADSQTRADDSWRWGEGWGEG